ncbi:class I SAM-dependent methyltransferase [Marinibaculum pumilum]|uniref:Class I SAM-dependent methyltransferase n=1 Tax=Marinibaculum pumilum TaxID=1766165 RepID=A0ABV7KZL1_9PROT
MADEPRPRPAFGGGAAGYDVRIRSLVPGYALLHDMLPALLVPRLAPDARILVAGAGTGADLLRLAACAPGWRFTAADPAADMLAQAQEKAAAAGCANRIDFHVAAVEQLPQTTPHDAALAVLVSQFAPDDGARQAFLAALAARLGPGAPLLLVDLAAAAPALRDGYRQWALDTGAGEAAVSAMFGRIAANFHPLTAARLTALLAEAGFGPPLRFFQALCYEGHLAERRG